MTAVDPHQRKWWKEIVVYQVYPRSYKDSNGDGVGDINGITDSLDYIKDLGAGAIWLSPVYPSPNEDNGYDISDYKDIHPEFGTMADFERFVAGAHERNIKVVMDVVVNHSSDQHPWFKEARKSKDNPYRDYYIWRDGKDGGVPNNWQSFFSGTVWQKNEATDDYYLHLFARGQPDLNWENPKVRNEVKDIIHFWAQKGVDGFRLDVINCISKVPGLPDAPIQNKDDIYHWAGEHFFNGPKFMEWMTEIKKDAFDKYDIFTVGETPEVTPEHGAMYTHAVTGVVSMLFQFELTGIDHEPGCSKWEHVPAKLSDIKHVTTKWQTLLGEYGWNSNYMENHDNARSVSRFASDSEQYREISAKMLAGWYLFLKGTPYIYQGQELGMTNVPFTSINDFQDIETMNYYNEVKELKKDITEENLMSKIREKSRDNARTPMQWNAGANAGFCAEDVKPWLKVNPNYQKINAQAAVADKNSVFHFFKRALEVKKEHKVSVYGDYDILAKEHDKIFAYTRTEGNDQILVVANFSETSVDFKLNQQEISGLKGKSASLLLGNYSDAPAQANVDGDLAVRPWEVRISKIKN